MNRDGASAARLQAARAAAAYRRAAKAGAPAAAPVSGPYQREFAAKRGGARVCTFDDNSARLLAGVVGAVLTIAINVFLIGALVKQVSWLLS